MRSKGNAPTAEQKRWYSWVADQGCCICANTPELHHVVGSSARNNKTKIGNWFILPLCYWHHRDQSNMVNVDMWKRRFEREHGTQKELFNKLLDSYIDTNDGKMPFGNIVYEAIMGC